MRVPVSLIFGVLLLAASTAPAQDLQYRIRTRVQAPSSPDQMREAETVMYIKGTSIRADNQMSGFSASVLVNAATGTLYVINHADRTFQEIPTDLAANRELMKGDTAQLRARGLIPEIIRTGETKTILGYQTTRIVSVQNNFMGGPAGDQTVMISDSWISQDPRLMEGFQASLNAAQTLLGGAGPQIAALPPEAHGLPLATTTLMLKRQGSDPIDPLALLQNPNPPGLLMRTELEAVEVKQLALPDSMFKVPAGYQKAN